MRKIIVASLGLSLLGGAAMFGQSTDTGSMKAEKKVKHKKGKKGETTSTTTSTSTSK